MDFTLANDDFFTNDRTFCHFNPFFHDGNMNTFAIIKHFTGSSLFSYGAPLNIHFLARYGHFNRLCIFYNMLSDVHFARLIAFFVDIELLFMQS